MRKYLILLLVMSLQIVARGQTAAVYDSLGLSHPTTAKALRYWIDNDASSAAVISEVNGKHTIDVSTLLDGLHTIHYQIIDSEDNVATPYSGIFLKQAKGTTSSKANTLRYWFDENRDVMTGNTGVQTIDASFLLDGLHTLHYQVVDNEGKASYIASGIFFKTGTEIRTTEAASFRYWFDDSNDVMTCNAASRVQTIDASSLLDGLHTLHFQVLDVEGKASYIASSVFYKSKVYDPSQKVTADRLTYWFDDQEVTTSIYMSDGVQLLDVSSLLDGLHTAHFIVGYSDESMTTPHSTVFLRMSIDTESTTAKSLRYWFDDKQDVTVTEASNGTQIIDASALIDGLHTVHCQLIDDKGVTATPMSGIFLKMTEGASMSAKSLRYWFDNDTEVKMTDAATGVQTIDVTCLMKGLHTVHCQLIDDKGKASTPVSGLFMKMYDKNIDSEGNVITQYMYWMNDNSVDNKKVLIDKPVSPYQLIALLPMIKAPIRSSEFHFEVTDGTPMMYAQNVFHVRFEDALGYWTDCSKSFIDYSVSKEVKPITPLTEVFGTVSMQRPESNAINWYSMECKYGDSIGVSASQATSIQIFSPSGEEVYNASGSTSVKVGGLHARDNGTFYIAVHDVTGSNQTMTLNYQHIDRYAILDWDVHTVGNGGCSTITFNGNGFNELYAVDLVSEKGDTIHHLAIGHESNTNAAIIFDFNGAEYGNYTALFRFTQETKAVDNIATVEEAKNIELSTSVSYPSTFLRGTSTTYTITVTNKGNMTAYCVPLEIKLHGISISAITDVIFEGYISKISDLSFKNISYTDEDDMSVLTDISDNANNLSQFIVYHDSVSGKDYGLSQLTLNMPPLSAKVIKVSIKSSDLVNLYAYTAGKWFPLSVNGSQRTQSLGSTSSSFRDEMCCLKDRFECGADIVANIAGIFIPPGASCLTSLGYNGMKTAYDVWCSEGSSASERWNNNVKSEATSLQLRLIGIVVDCISGYYGSKLNQLREERAMAAKLGSSTEVDRITAEILACRTAQQSAIRGVYNAVTDVIWNSQCWKAFTEVKPNCPPEPKGGGGTSSPVTSYNPNDIYGYQSKTGSKFVSGSVSEMPYRIEFENDTAFATANAHTVVIVDTLDSNVFDLSTFAPSQVKIGDKMETIDGSPDFVKTIDMRPDIYAIAQVQCKYDAANGIAKWTFTSLDPMTMEPADDVTQGFLPVNYDGDGIGEVSYTINLKPGLADGIHIDNRASIVFDSNKPILTPTWTNTMDTVAPVSRVSELVVVSDTVFDLHFSGEDNRSGIWKYTLYAQSNLGAPWHEVATDIAPDSVYSFKGYDCMDYGFCVIATDSAGNVEQKELVAEATRLVPMPGDVNSDRKIDSEDFNAVVDITLGITSSNYNEGAADVNKDGNVNVGDCVGLTNHLLYGHFIHHQQTITQSSGNMTAMIITDDFTVDKGETYDMEISLANLIRYTGLQMDVTLPAGLSFVKDDFGQPSVRWTSGCNHNLVCTMQSDSCLRILGYSDENALFTENETFVVAVRADKDAAGMARVHIGNAAAAGTDIKVSVLDGTYATVTFGKPSGIDNIDREDEVKNVYNILGQQVSGGKMANGIYIVNKKKVVVAK